MSRMSKFYPPHEVVPTGSLNLHGAPQYDECMTRGRSNNF